MSIPALSGVGRAKLLALCFSFALIGAVLSPIRQNWCHPPQDNFPLSYYPMFSERRKPIETFYYVVGRDGVGKRHFIREGVIGDGGENQVRRQLRKIIDAGRAPELAQQIAARVATMSGRRWKSIVSVSVCKGRYSVVARFLVRACAGDATGFASYLRRRVHPLVPMA